MPSVFSFAVMGDSLSTFYGGDRGADGDQSWTELLLHLRGTQVDIHNFARDGATSSGVVNGQASDVANLIAQGTLHYSVLEIGGNDEQKFSAQIAAGNYTAFVNQVTSNIERALSVVQQAGHVQQVLALVPDIGFTPSVQNKLHHDPVKIGHFLTATNLANQQLEAYAQANGIVVIDTVALGQLTQGASITLAGTATNDYWSPDDFHPSGVMQGLFSNAVMVGLESGFGADTSGLRFTDQAILSAAVDAGNPTIHTPTYYNVQPFVILPAQASAPAGSIPTSTSPNALLLSVLSPAPAPDGLGFLAAATLAPEEALTASA